MPENYVHYRVWKFHICFAFEVYLLVNTMCYYMDLFVGRLLVKNSLCYFLLVIYQYLPADRNADTNTQF